MTAKQSSEADISYDSHIIGAGLRHRILTALALAIAIPAAAQQKRVDYDISFPNAANHEALVKASFQGVTPGSPLQIRMSRSSPGRYSASGFAKNVYDMSATDGKTRPLTVTRTDAYGWEV